MINTYQYYSAGFGCNVQVSYKDGLFQKAETDNPEIELKFSEGNPVSRKAYFFIYEEGFLEATKGKTNVVKIEQKITFDMFWDKYNYKHVGGKVEASKAWEKLSDKDKQEAYQYITVYDSMLKVNPVAKLYGASYLNKKRWVR